MSRHTVTVLVPTYGRPEFLRRCLAAVARQTRPPEEILTVARPDDAPTRRAVESIARNTSTPIREVLVHAPGALPPLAAGMEYVSKDIVAVTNDDAEPYPDWLEAIESAYAEETVGAVGGAVEEFAEGSSMGLKTTAKIGKVLWYGGYRGGFNRLDSRRPVFEVDSLCGANMSYRAGLLRRIGFDPILNRGDGMHYEVDLGFKVRKQGFRILCNPAARVRHFNAGRSGRAAFGAPPPNLMESRSHNYAYAMLKHLSFPKKMTFLAWLWLIGHKSSWGLLYFLAAGWRQVENDRWLRLVAAYRGKMQGLRAFLGRGGKKGR